jgi:hypothetical protein
MTMLASWHSTFRDYDDWMILAVVLIIAWCWPLLGNRWFTAVENFGARLASRRGLAIVSIALFVILLRVSMLWVFPVRPPGVHDEFSYLLAGDTFSHGRLANPPHPMWIFFDTFHVLQQPTYASMYPPAQGAMLALGMIFGHPWIGVLLSMGIMFGALLWMLQGWLPPQWALLGALLPLFRFGIFSYWMNNYWGGAVPAIAGALVLGALPRIFRNQRPRDALLMGLGVGTLANSRPFEGLVLSVPVALVLLYWLVSRRSPSWRVTLPRVVVPLASVVTVTAAFMLYYNWRVTLNPFLFPHTLDDKLHLTVSNFVWGDQEPPAQYANHQFDVFYNHFVRNQYLHTWESFKQISWHKLTVLQDFFLGAALTVPFLALPWMLRDRRTRLLITFLALSAAGLFIVVWTNPHYAAPAMPVLFAIVVQLIRHLRRWKIGSRHVGIGLTRAIVVMALAVTPVYFVQVIQNPYTFYGLRWGQINWDRAHITDQLKAMPGQHLVIVRYSPSLHIIHDEWVYNAADIDHSKIVWAREISGVDTKPLLDYFAGRTVWIVEPDAVPHLIPYSPGPQP